MSRATQISLIVLILICAFGIRLLPVGAQGDNGRGEPRQGNRLFFDDFLTFVNQWQRIDAEAVRVNYVDQTLRFDLFQGGVRIASQPGTARVFEDFFIEVSLTYQPDSAANSSAGIQFGYKDNDDFYVFSLRPSGHYEVRLRYNGEWQPDALVLGYLPEVADNPLETYRLRMSYDAGLYELWLNDEPLTPFYNDVLDAGTFGLYAQSGNGPASVVFDDFAVYDLVYSDVETPDPGQSDNETEATPTPTAEPPQVPTIEPTPSPTETPPADDTPGNEDDGDADDAEDVTPPRI